MPGALFSVGDAHFAQGDGECCGTAVETCATFVARFELLKGEATRRRQRDPSYEQPGFFTTARRVCSAPMRHAEQGSYATTGISLRRDGRAESEDLTLAARNALLNMIDYLVDTRGFTRQQAYCLASVAVDLSSARSSTCPT